jgi:NADH-quinone oxidoreductase subunit N
VRGSRRRPGSGSRRTPGRRCGTRARPRAHRRATGGWADRGRPAHRFPAAFAVVAGLPQAGTPQDHRGLARRRPGLAAALVVCLFGLVGTPPTAVFVGTLTVFTAAVEAGLGWLAVLAVVNTVAGVFSCLRWIARRARTRRAAAGRRARTRPHPGRGLRLRRRGGCGALVGVLAGVVLPLLAGPVV